MPPEQVLPFASSWRGHTTVVNLIDPGVIVLGGGLQSNVALLGNDLEADVAR